MMAGVFFLAATLLLVPGGAEEIRVTPVVRDGAVLATFTAPGAITPGLREAIQSGLVVTFSYQVALRQGAFLWFDRTVAAVDVAASVRYDNLTRTYHVSRLLDGTVTWSESSTDAEQVRRWLTDFDRLPVASPAQLRVNTEYVLEIRARISPRRAWLLWPWGRPDAAGRAAFTYLR